MLVHFLILPLSLNLLLRLSGITVNAILVRFLPHLRSHSEDHIAVRHK